MCADVGFKVTQPTEALTPFTVDGSELRVVIWTTTPWTMPANLAIAVNGELEYSVVTHPSLGGKKYMVAKELVGALAKRMDDVLPEGAELEIVATFKGSEVTGTVYEHPFAGRESKVVLGGDYITTDSGTGLVHTAPGHGQDDYLTGLKYGLELLSPVNDAGEFTSEAGDDLEGLSVLGEGNTRCIEKLRASGALVREENYEHKYPYDWRTKEPTIFRATSQWFASVDGFREDALTAIDNVKWQPEIGRNRITAMTQSRSDWCISRQRTWGVPIPVFYHRDTQEVLLDEDTLEHAYKLIGEHGTDIWWSASEKELLPAKYADVADQYQKGTDTMDVWFDSGSSWASVVLEREELSERYPADLYLEGSDQHRGWFQSSLLTSVAVNGHAPYKTVLTHGFVLDEKGYKMSKSLGNVVDPNLVIEGGADLKKQPGYGADTLRLWVSSVNYASDVCIGDGIVKQTSDSYRKLRNTARYVIGSLHDFDPAKHAVPYEQLPALDQYMLGELDAFVAESKASYDDYAFSRVYSLLQQFAVSDLSNFYLDVAKDRLYISHADDTRRRTCQTVMYQVLHAMSAVLAPILPHMAEDIWQALPYTTAHTSVFEAGWPAAATPDSAASSVAEGKAEWGALRVLRDAVNKAIEQARNEKSIGASLEAKVVVHSTDPQLSAALAKYASETNEVDDLRYVLLVSGVEVVGSADEATSKGTLAALTEPLPDLSEDSTVTIGIAKADGAKCERCWNYYTELSDTKADYPSVCERCTVALTKMSYPKVGHLSPKPAAAAQPAPAAKPAPPAPAAATGASPDRLKKVDELINRVRASDGTVIDGFIASSTVLLDSLGSLRSTPVASSSAATAPQAAAKDSTLDEAEAVYRRALANKQKLLGDNHPDTVTATKNLATSLQMQGKVAEAQTLLAGMPDAVVSQVAATPPPAPPPAPTPAPAPAPAPAAATPTVAAETGEPSGASTILTYDATLRKAGIAPKDAILLTPAALASKAGLSLLAAPATAAAPAEAAAPQADNLEDAVAAQGALVRKLKEDDGLTNADPAVQAAVAELKRLKGLAEPAVA